jgi:hypothetical protein
VGSINGKLSGRGTYVDTNNDGVVDGLVHTIKNAGNFNTFSISNGVLTVQGPTGGSAIGGSDTHVQFNDGGAMQGESTMAYNKTSNTLSVSNLTVSGTLTVSTTTTLTSNTVAIGDNIILLNSDITGSGNGTDAGIEIGRGDDANVQLLWDETEGAWDFDVKHLYSIGSVQASGSGAVYTFTSDTNTGIEHVGADQLGLLVGGTRVLMVNANGVEIAPAGADGAGSNQALLVDNISIDTNTITSVDTNGDLNLGANGNGAINITPAGTGDVVISTDTVTIIGSEGESATLKLIADESDDVSDEWHIEANTDGTLTLENDIASNGVGVAHLTITPHATVASSTTAVAGHLTVAGNFTVSGTTTTVSSTNTHVADTIITLNSGEAGNGITGNLAGIEIDRGETGGSDNDLAKFLFDDSVDSFKTLLGSAAAPIVTGDITAPIVVIDQNNTVTTNQTVKALSVDFDATGITASGQTANYTALDIALNTDAPTQVGTVNNKGIDVNLTAATSGTQTNTGLTVTVGGADTNYSALFSGGNVGIGTATPSSSLEIQDGLTTTGSVLTLSTKEPTVVDNDVIGQINFRAPLETGADALLLLASISAVANEAFDADQNQTELVLSTASGDAAAERVRITHDGDVQVAGLTASEILITDANKGLTSAAVATYPSLAELAYVKGVTSAVQTQLNAKQATITGSATTIDTESLTASRAVISNGSQKIDVSATTSTELGYVNGVTSAIQTQIDTKEQIGKKTMWVPASAMSPTVSNGCSALTQVETTSGRPDMVVLDFATGADEFAQFSVAFPKSWNLGTVTFQAFWSGIAATTDCDWSVQGVAMNDNQTIDVAYGTAVVVSDNAQGAVEELLVSAESGAITIAGTPADNDLCFFRVGRDVSGDDMNGDARLHGIKIFYTTDAVNDA